MRRHTTLDIDADLVREAGAVLGTVRMTDTIHAALAEVVRRRRRETLLDIDVDLDLAALDAIRGHRFARWAIAPGEADAGGGTSSLDEREPSPDEGGRR